MVALRERLTKRARVLAVGAAVLAVMVVMLAFPMRNMFNQQREVTETKAEIAELKAQNRELEVRANALSDPAELELEARKNHGLVFPGEETYSVLPPPGDGRVPNWVAVGLTFDPAGTTSGDTPTDGSTSNASAAENPPATTTP